MQKRDVTERDFRMPQFVDANPSDYEFRSDGAIVRKDRWEKGINSIRHLVGVSKRSYEIDEVIDRVRQIASISDDVLQAIGDDICQELQITNID